MIRFVLFFVLLPLGGLLACASPSQRPRADAAPARGETMLLGSSANQKLGHLFWSERFQNPHPHGARSQPLEALVEETITSVPSFHLVDTQGGALHSDDLVGKRAFAVFFFATWCELCARKMPMIRRVLEKVNGVRTVLVSVDAQATYSHVPGFLREQRMEDKRVVNGLEFPRFTQGYNPVGSIPLIAVVGRSGELVDYQIGLQSGDGQRLEAAFRTALIR